MARGERPDVRRDAGDPGVEGVGGEGDGEGLGFVGELPCHYCGVLAVEPAVYGVLAGNDGLDVVFVPALGHLICIYLVREIRKLVIRMRAIQHGRIITPSRAGGLALRRRRHVPGGGIRDGCVVAGPGDVLGEAAGPLPFVVEGHGGADAAFGELVEADVEAGEELFVVDSGGGEEGWVHTEGLRSGSAFGRSHDAEVVDSVGLGRGVLLGVGG